MQLILLASGLGSRLGKYTSKVPKGAVLLNKKPLIMHNLEFYKKFKKRIAVIGYKKHIIKEILIKENFTFVENKKFTSTNMVESMFACHKLINDDVVICYSDIIFNKKIFNNLNTKENIMPININWLELWKKRMRYKEIKDDAEDIKLKKNMLISIGNKIKNKFPKFQFMGLIKLTKDDYNKLKDFYIININNKKIDLTTFLNEAIKNNIIDIKISKTSKYWYEVDTIKDLQVIKTLIK